MLSLEEQHASRRDDGKQRMLKYRIGETRRTCQRKPRLSSQVPNLTGMEDFPINRDRYSGPCGGRYADWPLLNEPSEYSVPRACFGRVSAITTVLRQYRMVARGINGTSVY